MLLFQKVISQETSFLAESDCEVQQDAYGTNIISGTIYSRVLNEDFGKGWRVKADQEWYRITYVRKNELNGREKIEFDGVHEVMYRLEKSCQYGQISRKGIVIDWLSHAMNGSSVVFKYSGLYGDPVIKENFGLDTRWNLIKSVLDQYQLYCRSYENTFYAFGDVHNDSSILIVRSGLNLKKLEWEQDSSDFATYQKGYGAFFDEDDPSKGRLTAEYKRSDALLFDNVIIEAAPFVDERFTVKDNLILKLSENLNALGKTNISVDVSEMLDINLTPVIPKIASIIRLVDEGISFNQFVLLSKLTKKIDVNGKITLKNIGCELIDQNKVVK